MTSQHVPFNGDHLIGAEIRRLVREFGLQWIIETGMWSAHSTREFATMVPRVVSIDATHDHLIEEFGPDAVAQLERSGVVRAVLGDSARDLPRLLAGEFTPGLIYLDAHGGGHNGSNVNPLMEELEAIGADANCRDRCVVCIHDFQVPGKPWGYNGGDWGRGFEPLSYNLIQSGVQVIYPGGHGYHYNEEAAGLQRGIIYIYPARNAQQ